MRGSAALGYLFRYVFGNQSYYDLLKRKLFVVHIHEGKIVENPNHYSHNQEKMDDLFDKIKSSLNSVQIEVSGALAKGDKTKIAYLKKLFETYAMTEMNEIIEKAEKEYLEKDVNIDQDEI